MKKGRQIAEKLFVMGVLLITVSCSTFTNPITEPSYPFIEPELTYGPPEFRAGYKDGCHTALSAYGNSYQKSVYGIQKNPEYQDNQVYNQVWRDAWNYCYKMIFVSRRKDPLYGEPLL